MRHVFPLLDLGWGRTEFLTYLRSQGWENTPKSACIGCPFHDNTYWRRLRDTSLDEWAGVGAFNEAIRHGHPAPPPRARPPVEPSPCTAPASRSPRHRSATPIKAPRATRTGVPRSESQACSRSKGATARLFTGRSTRSTVSLAVVRLGVEAGPQVLDHHAGNTDLQLPSQAETARYAGRPEPSPAGRLRQERDGLARHRAGVGKFLCQYVTVINALALKNSAFRE